MQSTKMTVKRRWAAMVCSLALFVITPTYAQTLIYVQNDTSWPLSAKQVVVTGDPISAKAYKSSDVVIEPGERKKVLTLNRTGKVNWMDPTPRFIEPGKTALFATHVGMDPSTADSGVTLKQTLTGTGSSSKMQYTLEGVGEKQAWTLDNSERKATWNASAAGDVTVSYRAYDEGDDTHVEYVFAN